MVAVKPYDLKCHISGRYTEMFQFIHIRLLRLIPFYPEIIHTQGSSSLIIIIPAHVRPITVSAQIPNLGHSKLKCPKKAIHSDCPSVASSSIHSCFQYPSKSGYSGALSVQDKQNGTSRQKQIHLKTKLFILYISPPFLWLSYHRRYYRDNHRDPRPPKRKNAIRTMPWANTSLHTAN